MLNGSASKHKLSFVALTNTHVKISPYLEHMVQQSATLQDFIIYSFVFVSWFLVHFREEIVVDDEQHLLIFILYDYMNKYLKEVLPSSIHQVRKGVSPWRTSHSENLFQTGELRPLVDKHNHHIHQLTHSFMNFTDVKPARKKKGGGGTGMKECEPFTLQFVREASTCR